MKKTRTFQLQRASLVESPPPPAPLPPQATSHVPRNSPLIEFPTSPQLILGEDMLHFSHPQHPLSHINLPDLFTCAGCKEYGAGTRFACQQCQFELHEFCALAPPVLKSHPFHLQHHLLFYSKPAKSGILNSKCDICGKPTKGYNFRCTVCGFQMHPCCAMLSTDINYSGHPHPQLKLLPATTLSNGGNHDFVCAECNRKRSGRVYRCTVCDYHLHAVCAKNRVNGLQANGHKGKEKASMLGTAARIASQVVIEFIGGLVEGLGEGVGQVLIQSVGRGRNNTTRRSTIE
ncbi:hypothetical protein HS088_TW11G01084 [Tripterygium wilfordii]|uniref:DC1 domain-containing protein n=1 Tax=Tripterygium wilfordii TaxID=458696 RepID=A0A7J7D3U1_TRIWF|nr:E3 ubiquitin-protein ligase SNT2 [Tripterygium wilfordii]KAF5741002.1 hypothetical protein HS088_TW11G01084 [Tripterygium wilfordii]